MGLLPDTQYCGLRMHRERRERFPRHRGVSDPGMQSRRMKHVPWCMSKSLTHSGRENVPSIPGAWATRNFAYLVRGPWSSCFTYCLVCFLWNKKFIIVRRAGLLWSQQDFEWRWSVPLFKCLTVLEFSFILFDLCLLITFFNFIMNYVPIVTLWIFTYHKIWILSIMFCFIWSYWIIYFLACLEVSWGVVS